jgi:NAD dependent epimerase/dehydratase family enzyme
MGNLVLGSRRIMPARLLAAGFEFAHPTIEDQLEVAF